MKIYEALRWAKEQRDAGIGKEKILSYFMKDTEVSALVKIYLNTLLTPESDKIFLEQRAALRAVLVRFGESILELNHHLIFTQPDAFKPFARIEAESPRELFDKLLIFSKELFDRTWEVR